MSPQLHRLLHSSAGLLLIVLQNAFAPSAIAEIEVDGLIFDVFPQSPSTFHPVVLSTTIDTCRGFTITGADVSVDHESMTIDIDFVLGGGLDISPCPPNTFLDRVNIPISGIREAGNYQLDFYSSSVFQGSAELAVEEIGPMYWIETPMQDSLQSGIGIVRGWACDAESVELQFDNLPRQAVAYGDSRTDTIDVCGDEDNGYGFVVGWGNLGLGPHRMRTYIDGVEVADVEFVVVGLDDPFITGASGQYELDNFPNIGEVSTIEWSEPEQKFIIIEKSP